MKAIILCAGFGTRLYPLTQNKPKALLTVKGKTLLDLLIENINEIDEIDEIVIVSNHKFYNMFYDASRSLDTYKKIRVLDDGVSRDSEHLGAIRDIKFAIEQIRYNGEIMVLAGDNYFDFSLKDMYDFYLNNGRKATVFGQYIDDMKVLRSCGVAQLDENNKIVSMEEKPQSPKGNFAVGPFYIYNKMDTSLINYYLSNHGNPDAPGNYPAWLCKNGREVYAYNIYPHHFIDIGTPEAYYGIDDTIDGLMK